MDLTELHWIYVEMKAKVGDLAPLADALRRLDMPMPPAEVWASLRLLLADLAEDRRPRKPKGRRIADPQHAQLIYLAGRAEGMSSGKALELVMERFSVERTIAYAAVSPVLRSGEVIAASVVRNRKA